MRIVMRKFVVAIVLMTLAVAVASCDGGAKEAVSVTVDHTQTYTYTTEEIWCSNDGMKIYGQAYIPSGKERWPLIIYSHGLNSSHKTGIPYAEKFVASGYAVYCFDFCGGGDEVLSDGAVDDMTVFTEKEDLKAVISEMRSKAFVDTTRIYLMGASLGGLVTALAAPEVQDIRNILLLYPALNVPDVARAFYTEDGSLKDPEKPSPLGNDRMNMSVYAYDPYEHIAGFTNQVFIIHGSEDKMVPMAYSQRALSCYSQGSSLFVIGGAGHSFTGDPQSCAAEMALHQFNLWENQ